MVMDSLRDLVVIHFEVRYQYQEDFVENHVSLSPLESYELLILDAAHRNTLFLEAVGIKQIAIIVDQVPVVYVV
jgi:hypothetical protein